MTDQEWSRFYAGMMFAAGPKRVGEIMAAMPDLREELGRATETPGEALMRDHGIEVAR